MRFTACQHYMRMENRCPYITNLDEKIAKGDKEAKEERREMQSFYCSNPFHKNCPIKLELEKIIS